MSTGHVLDLGWWITVVEIPVLAGLFWLNWRARRDAEVAVAALRERTERALDGVRQSADAEMHALREGLGAYKLEVAKSYASIGLLKDVEARLTAHLLRIERKLDPPHRTPDRD